MGGDQALGEGKIVILPTFGIHPWEAHHYVDRLEELDEPIAESAHIGEIGLNFHWVKEQDRWPQQEIVFDYFIQLAVLASGYFVCSTMCERAR